jgi:hypothetical protein
VILKESLKMTFSKFLASSSNPFMKQRRQVLVLILGYWHKADEWEIQGIRISRMLAKTCLMCCTVESKISKE